EADGIAAARVPRAICNRRPGLHRAGIRPRATTVEPRDRSGRCAGVARYVAVRLAAAAGADRCNPVLLHDAGALRLAATLPPRSSVGLVRRWLDGGGAGHYHQGCRIPAPARVDSLLPATRTDVAAATGAGRQCLALGAGTSGSPDRGFDLARAHVDRD